MPSLNVVIISKKYNTDINTIALWPHDQHNKIILSVVSCIWYDWFTIMDIIYRSLVAIYSLFVILNGFFLFSGISVIRWL